MGSEMCIRDRIRTRTILEMGSMTGEYILGYLMGHNFDIDTEEELVKADRYLNMVQGRARMA